MFKKAILSNTMLKKPLLLSLLLTLINTTVSAQSTQPPTQCGTTGTWLQVLGSGGPELDDNRASSSYLIWHKGQAKFLVDMGTGSMFNFEKSGAKITDLDAIMLSHMHVDHSNDLPPLIKASFFTDRTNDLLLFGPSGNDLMPAVTQYTQNLLGEKGAYRYLSDYLTEGGDYRLIPKDIDVNNLTEHVAFTNNSYTLTAIPVHHGPLPALAWKININGKSIAFSGDMSNKNNTLATLAKKVDILVAHNAVPEPARGIARNLHMPPSVIGEIAAKAKVKSLVISHRMNRTLGKEENTTANIRKHYQGPISFAEDLQCFKL